MIYVIDHNDSFTHNVVHQFALFDKVECDNYDKWVAIYEQGGVIGDIDECEQNVI